MGLVWITQHNDKSIAQPKIPCELHLSKGIKSSTL